jgi:O-acetyl-ADP-ribose deacetylase (regulator of RNase III)
MAIKIEVVRGDITEAKTEAIVNAANNHLWMGSGVAGAIKRKGGEVIEKEAMAKGPIGVGEAVATTAGKLPHKYVIHAAGMGQDAYTDSDIVYRVTQSSLRAADELGVKSIAFPAIGTGVGGMSIEACAGTMIKAVNTISPDLKNIVTVQFVLFDENGYKAFENELKKGS